MSLVRSLKRDEIDPEPSLSWLREHLGFLTDEHQMNVGLTRARRGLCIIGEMDCFCLFVVFFLQLFYFLPIIQNYFHEQFNPKILGFFVRNLQFFSSYTNNPAEFLSFWCSFLSSFVIF